MSELYVIQWLSRVNGRSGRGTKTFQRKEAERLAGDLNRDFPEIEHAALLWHPAEIEAAVPGEPIVSVS